ncbi:Probable F-box protein At2g36090 [Linum perenne]
MDSSGDLSEIHQDIIRSHILTRLDGVSLLSAACASTELSSLASQENLWRNVCRSTWPSTDVPRIQELISAFPNGHRSFFSSSFPLVADMEPHSASSESDMFSDELISAVDIYHRGELIFSRAVETETITGWFRCSPFRIDLLDPKDTCPTRIPRPETEADCHDLAEELTLSWVLIDPAGRRAVNLSSHRPVSVQKHWLSGDVHARFAVILAGERGTAAEFVQCGIVVTCGGGFQEGAMHVREVSLQMENMDGMYMNGKDSMVILDRTFEGKRGIKERGGGKYEEFQGMKRQRREKKRRAEGAMDTMCVASAVLIFASLALLLMWRQ